MEKTILEVLILLANIGILGLNLKLYTEYFKDKSISNPAVQEYLKEWGDKYDVI